MKKIISIFFLIVVTAVLPCFAVNRTYLELRGEKRGPRNSKLKISIDFGRNGWLFMENKDEFIIKETGALTIFNSLLDAANYLGRNGWILNDIYVDNNLNNEVYHWIFYKDIESDNDIKAGFIGTGVLKSSCPKSYLLIFNKRTINSSTWDTIKEEIRENITEDELDKIIDDWEKQSSEYYIFEVEIKNYLK